MLHCVKLVIVIFSIATHVTIQTATSSTKTQTRLSETAYKALVELSQNSRKKGIQKDAQLFLDYYNKHDDTTIPVIIQHSEDSDSKSSDEINMLGIKGYKDLLPLETRIETITQQSIQRFTNMVLAGCCAAALVMCVDMWTGKFFTPRSKKDDLLMGGVYSGFMAYAFCNPRIKTAIKLGNRYKQNYQRLGNDLQPALYCDNPRPQILVFKRLSRVLQNKLAEKLTFDDMSDQREIAYHYKQLSTR